MKVDNLQVTGSGTMGLSPKDTPARPATAPPEPHDTKATDTDQPIGDGAMTKLEEPSVVYPNPWKRFLISAGLGPAVACVGLVGTPHSNCSPHVTVSHDTRY